MAQHVLSADRPKTNPTDDRLGDAPFAKHLAESICKMNAVEGLVIAVYGSWGSGKTSVLNFLLHYLREKPKDEQPIYIPFNPWWFSGHEDLTRSFFNQLQSKLSGTKNPIKKLRNHIADLADIVSKVPIPYAQAGEAVGKAVRVRKKDVTELKEEIS